MHLARALADMQVVLAEFPSLSIAYIDQVKDGERWRFFSCQVRTCTCMGAWAHGRMGARVCASTGWSCTRSE